MMMFDDIPIGCSLPVLSVDTPNGRENKQITCLLTDFSDDPLGYGFIGLVQIEIINFFQAMYC